MGPLKLSMTQSNGPTAVAATPVSTSEAITAPLAGALADLDDSSTVAVGSETNTYQNRVASREQYARRSKSSGNNRPRFHGTWSQRAMPPGDARHTMDSNCYNVAEWGTARSCQLPRRTTLKIAIISVMMKSLAIAFPREFVLFWILFLELRDFQILCCDTNLDVRKQSRFCR